ncbi:MAG: hypothetical protein HC854_15175 [Flavobacterium sp.]|nr:hypothetical protein [Flavobacterium sp.]
MAKETLIINEFQEYLNFKNLVIAHCDNVYRMEKGNGIVPIDDSFNFEKKNVSIIQGTLNDFFRNQILKIFQILDI